MSLQKPYKRIYRPIIGVDKVLGNPEEYLEDSRYIDIKERQSLINAARLIVRDFENLFDYIEPCEQNKGVYSHRIYELLLRTATEFEANCKGVLVANGYAKCPKDLCVKDYKRLDTAMKLSEYKVEYSRWNPINAIKPFEDWSRNDPLSWYQAYNHVKHNRYDNFCESSLETLLTAISGLLCLLVAQFHSTAACINNGQSYYVDIDGQELDIEHFHIDLPEFPVEECYSFDWQLLEQDADAFVNYQFSNRR